MNARLAVVAVAVVGAGVSSCALLSAIQSGNPTAIATASANLAEKGIRAVAEAREESERQCAPLLNARVAYPEERAIGGAIAIALTQNTRARYFLDGMTEKDPAALKLKADKHEVTLPASDKNALGAWVAVVGQNLANASHRPDIRWNFGVLDSPTANAFSAPGGYVIVTTGLLKLVDNEAQLAGVLAHELGHVNSFHAIKAYNESKNSACKLALAAKIAKEKGLQELPADLSRMLEFADVFARALGAGGALDLDGGGVSGKLIATLTDGFVETFLGKGNAKEQEFEADRTALELLLGAGYDSTQYDALLKKAPSKGGMLDNHPSTDDRLAALNALRTGEFAFLTPGKVKGDAPALKVVKK